MSPNVEFCKRTELWAETTAVELEWDWVKSIESHTVRNESKLLPVGVLKKGTELTGLSLLKSTH